MDEVVAELLELRRSMIEYRLDGEETYSRRYIWDIANSALVEIGTLRARIQKQEQYLNRAKDKIKQLEYIINYTASMLETEESTPEREAERLRGAITLKLEEK